MMTMMTELLMKLIATIEIKHVSFLSSPMLTVTGVDFSDVAISEAKKLANLCGQSTDFIESDVYAYNNKGNEKFLHHNTVVS